MRKQIFTAIAEKLLTIPGIDYVDLWNDNGSHFAGFMHTISATNHANDEIIEDVECFLTSAQDTTAIRRMARIDPPDLKSH